MLRALVLKELLSLTRDPHGLGALFIMPVVFIVVMSMALKDVYSPPLKEVAWAVDAREDSAMAHRLIERWRVHRGDPEALPADWQQALKQGSLKYVIVVETGFEAGLGAMQAPQKPVLRLVAEAGMDGGLYRSSVAELAAIASAERAQLLIGNLTGVTADQLGDKDGLVAGERLSTAAKPSSVQHNVPAWLVFGMFFVVTAMGGLFVQERNDGTLARLKSMGVSQSLLVLSKALPYLLVNCLQAMLMLAVGRWLMPVLGADALSFEGVHAGALVLMVLGLSLAAVSLALALSAIVRSHAQANAIGPLANVIMAAIGGIMVPTFVMPPVMQRIAAWSPMNWGLEGLLDVLLRGATPGALWPRLLPLIVFAAVMLGVAVLSFSRRLDR